MERPQWRNEEILAELEELDITQIIDFGIGQLLMDPMESGQTGAGTTLLCFVHGNVDKTQVRDGHSSTHVSCMNAQNCTCER